jgi:hypothetical protein
MADRPHLQSCLFTQELLYNHHASQHYVPCTFAIVLAKEHAVIHYRPHQPAVSLYSYLDIMQYRMYFDCTFQNVLN